MAFACNSQLTMTTCCSSWWLRCSCCCCFFGVSAVVEIVMIDQWLKDKSDNDDLLSHWCCQSDGICTGYRQAIWHDNLLLESMTQTLGLLLLFWCVVLCHYQPVSDQREWERWLKSAAHAPSMTDDCCNEWTQMIHLPSFLIISHSFVRMSSFYTCWLITKSATSNSSQQKQTVRQLKNNLIWKQQFAHLVTAIMLEYPDDRGNTRCLKADNVFNHCCCSAWLFLTACNDKWRHGEAEKTINLVIVGSLWACESKKRLWIILWDFYQIGMSQSFVQQMYHINSIEVITELSQHPQRTRTRRATAINLSP